jgi:hypothetical protein
MDGHTMILLLDFTAKTIIEANPNPDGKGRTL